MTEALQSQLNWEASATATHPQVSSSLPPEVETCLKNARFVRLMHMESTLTRLIVRYSYTWQHATACLPTYLS